MTEVNTQAQTRTVLTTAEKITKLEGQLAALYAKRDEEAAKAAAAEAFTNVGAGDTVTFNQGRAETLRLVTGSVLARGVVDGKDVVKVIGGEGLDTAIYQVKVSDLKSVVPAGAAQPEVASQVSDAAADDNNIDDLLSDVSAQTEANLNAVTL